MLDIDSRSLWVQSLSGWAVFVWSQTFHSNVIGHKVRGRVGQGRGGLGNERERVSSLGGGQERVLEFLGLPIYCKT